MALESLSPEMREIVRRLMLRVRKRGYVGMAELDSALGPREITADMLEDILSHFQEEGVDLREE